MNIKQIFGKNLKKYRKEQELSQEKLSENLEISVKHLSNIECGKKFASPNLIERIVKFFNISPSALFYEEEKIKTEDSIEKISEIIESEFKKAKKEIIQKIIEI